MKKTIYCLLLFSFGFASCKKLSNLLTFEISNSENIKIPASGILTVPIISPVPVTMNSEESFENNNTRANLVKDVVLKKLTLTITDPAAENFNFLKSIRIYIGTDNNDKVPLASLDNIPMGVSTIELISDNSKLDKYVKASSYKLYTEVEIKSNITKELNVRADSKFKVTADPL
ncbi:hypothetical protein ACX0G7_12395 [Flavitalea antarctica]